MAVVLIAYDLMNPGQNYIDIKRFISMYPHIKLSESAYAVETDDSPKNIFSRLKQYLEKNDILYIITLTPPFDGQGKESSNRWLQQRL